VQKRKQDFNFSYKKTVKNEKNAYNKQKNNIISTF